MCHVSGPWSEWVVRISPPTARAMQDTASADGSVRTFCSTWRCQSPSPSQGRRLLCIEQQGDTVSGVINGLITQSTADSYNYFPCRGPVLSVIHC